MVAKRERVKIELLRTEPAQQFFSSGCALLDCVIGGGWAVGKVINIVGDRSTGKTLLAIEACANYVRARPAGRIDYIEAEAAFDPVYARTLGLPEDRISLLNDVGTVEGFWRHVEAAATAGDERLIILDSLDALSDEAEQKREVGDATYGAAKSKLLSEGFRKHIRIINASKLTMIFISQIRDKIGAMPNAKQVQRSGGRALDFYCSQVLWLYERGKIKKTVGGLERAVGLNIQARCEKNKVGMPWRECDVPIIYGYGMDDARAALEWLAKAAPEVMKTIPVPAGVELSSTNWQRYVKKLDRAAIARVLRTAWDRVEAGFAPESTKYGPTERVTE